MTLIVRSPIRLNKKSRAVFRTPDHNEISIRVEKFTNNTSLVSITIYKLGLYKPLFNGTHKAQGNKQTLEEKELPKLVNKAMEEARLTLENWEN